MSEEEKKAIEDLRKLCIEVLREDELLTYDNYSPSEKMTMVDILLNLVKKQQEEIEKKDKEIKCLKCLHNKQIKILDEMVKYIDKITEEIAREKGVEDFEFCDNECANKDEYIDCIDCIKQYFKNKVEGSK